MTTNPSALALTQARAAFRRSQWLERLVPTTLVLFLVVPVWLFGSVDNKTAAFGLLALLAAFATTFLGREVQRLALPGIIAGSCPLLCGLIAAHSGHVCAGGMCSTLCVPACLLSGGVAGALLGRLWARLASSLPVVGVSALLCWSVGALGCACAGHGGVTALSLGFVASAALSLAWLRRSS